MEKVNTGGLVSFEYSKNYKPSPDPEFDYRCKKLMRIGKRRIRREKIRNRMIIGIILIILGLVSFYFKQYWQISIIVSIIGLFVLIIYLTKMFKLKSNEEWVTKEDLDYKKEESHAP
jgi:hypothetical protein